MIRANPAFLQARSIGVAVNQATNLRMGRLTTLVLSGAAVAAAALALGCQTEADTTPAVAAYRDRMHYEYEKSEDAKKQGRPAEATWSEHEPEIRLAGQEATTRRSLLTTTMPMTTSQPAPEDVLKQIPDPSDAERVFAERLADVDRAFHGETRIVTNYRRVTEYARELLKRLTRTRQVRLSLSEAIQRALVNNYSIRIEAYGPAISQAQLVAAEAAFDAVFFLDVTYQKNDQAGSTIDVDQPQNDSRSYSGGIRKLLPTGMVVSTSLGQSQAFVNFPTKQNTVYNPAFETTFTVQFTQPLLRGFGLDYNRAGITVRQLDLKISRERFFQQVRDRLLDVETTYWQLSQARRGVLTLAESTGQFRQTYDNLVARGFEVTPIELNQSLSGLYSADVQFNEVVKTVRDLEDQLKNLLNDPELLLSDNIEIIPTETPVVAPIAVDQFAEVRTSLDERSELRQAKLAIEQSRVATMRAKNETLPKLDLGFQYEVQGLRGSADDSFDNMTTARYQNYGVSLNFELPIGNRAAEANLRAARSTEMQSIVRYKQAADLIVQEVNNAIRALNFGYENIPTQLRAVEASNESLRAFQARTEKIDPTYLETELSRIQNLSSTRAELARVVSDYNTAIVALEKAKGTLLRYNNIRVDDESIRR